MRTRAVTPAIPTVEAAAAGITPTAKTPTATRTPPLLPPRRTASTMALTSTPRSRRDIYERPVSLRAGDRFPPAEARPRPDRLDRGEISHRAASVNRPSRLRMDQLGRTSARPVATGQQGRQVLDASPLRSQAERRLGHTDLLRGKTECFPEAIKAKSPLTTVQTCIRTTHGAQAAQPAAALVIKTNVSLATIGGMRVSTDRPPGFSG